MELDLNFLILFILWLIVLLFFRLFKIWVFYFIWGSIGFTLLSVFALSNTIVERFLSENAIRILTLANQHLGIPVMPFAGVGTFLMTGTGMNGYTSLEIGTECSGLLEVSVFTGLVLFYPVFKRFQRFSVLIIGGLLIYLINLFRVELIIVFVHLWGRDAIFISHTIIGRGVFFLFMISLYWFFFTKTALVFLNRKKAS